MEQIHTDRIGVPIIDKTLIAISGQPFSFPVRFVRPGGGVVGFYRPKIGGLTMAIAGNGQEFYYYLGDGITMLSNDTIVISGELDKNTSYRYWLFHEHGDGLATIYAKGFVSVISQDEANAINNLPLDLLEQID